MKSKRLMSPRNSILYLEGHIMFSELTTGVKAASYGSTVPRSIMILLLLTEFVDLFLTVCY